jgi:hypothetical protein
VFIVYFTLVLHYLGAVEEADEIKEDMGISQ